MNDENNIILSICIPTYNRAKFLDRLISSISSQAEEINADKKVVEVVILDNFSQDETESQCMKYVEKYKHWLKYKRHSENLGMDGNFEAAYNIADGRFFWMLGDDEVICRDGLKCLVGFLQRHRDVSLLNVKSVFISQDQIGRKNAEEFQVGIVDNYRVYDDAAEFIKAIGIWVTFISGIIVNKSTTNIKIPGIIKEKRTNLHQLSWVFSALKYSSGPYIDIKHPIVIAEPENSGGYNILKVFSESFIKIALAYFRHDSKVMSSLKRSSLYFVIPFVFNKHISKNFSVGDAKTILDSMYMDIVEYRYVFRFLVNKYNVGYIIFNLFKAARKMFGGK